MTLDDAVASETVITPSTSHLPAPPEAISDLSHVTAAPATEGLCYPPEDSSCASSPDSPSYVTMEPPHRPQLETAAPSQPDIEISTEGNNYGPLVDVADSETQPLVPTLAPVHETTGISPEEISLDHTPQESQEPVPVSAPEISGRAPRTGPKTCPHCPARTRGGGTWTPT